MMNNTIVFGFGRFNPPTIGHKKLIDKIVSYANKYGADSALYLSHKQNKDKDPLSYETKLSYCRKAFPEINVIDSNAKTIIEILQELNKQGYTNVVYICGDDRLDAMQSLLNSYNGNPDKQGNVLYKFNSINIKSAGKRDDESKDFIETVSATKARELVKENNFNEFKKYIPLPEKDALSLFNDIRTVYGLTSMRLTESTHIDRQLKLDINDALKQIPGLSLLSAGNHSHYSEIARVRLLPSMDELDAVDVIKEVLQDYPITIYEYDDHPEASGTYKSIRIKDENGNDYYITLSVKQKKEFVPNKILSKFIGQNISCSGVANKIEYKNDPDIELILKTVIEEAMNATCNDTSALKNIMTESTVFNVSFDCSETATLLSQLNSQSLNRIINGIEVDFNEIYSAVAIASCIEKAYNANAYITFPSASNMPLIDYTINTPKMPTIRVSAKAGGGAHPSSSSVFNFINSYLKSNNIDDSLKLGASFSAWMHDEYLSRGVNEGYIYLSDVMQMIINGREPYEWVSALPLATISKELNQLKEIDFDNNPDYNEVKLICDQALQKLGDKPMQATFRTVYTKPAITRCLVKVLVALINNSDLIRQMNTLLNYSFGTFIQVHTSKTLTAGKITIEVHSINETTGYKFVFNTGIESDGKFKNNKLALAIEK